MDPGTAPVREGDVLAGKYCVERVLGVGGMGVVVAARHVQLGQKVALKFLLPAALTNAGVVARFDQEARAAARLRSQHVARTLDVGTMENGAPYIVMEHLEGCDLADLVQKRGPLRIDEAADYLLQICEAIAEAHGLGIIHRDLKPRNLFVTTGVDGRPLLKVLDFGISKVVAEEGSGALSLTRTTEVIGSPNYMPPEQLRSARMVDARSDIWSLGVVLFEMLTGTVPFDAETLPQLCSMVIQDPPRPLAQLRPEVPAGLVAIVERCLQKDPAWRFQNVAELAAALEPFVMAADSRTARIVRIAPGVPAPNASNPMLADTELGGSGARVAHHFISQSTGAPSSRDVPARTSTGKLGVVIAAVVVSVGAALAVGIWAGRTRGADEAPPSAAPTALAPPASLPLAAASIDPAPAATASAEVATLASAASAAPRLARPPSKGHANPKPAPPDDGLPNVRH